VATITAPEASKAATLTPDGDLTFFSFPIEKTEDTADGDVIVYGKATDGTLDSDLQIVDPEWSAKALRQWFDTGANVRVQHQARRDPAGKGLDIQLTPDGHYVKALVVEPVAKKLVRKGVLQDFSVGIMNPDIRVHDPAFKHLPNWDKAINGVLTGRQDGLSKIGEVSLCDRGSNFGTRFTMVKAAADGAPEFVGKVSAPDDVIAKVSAPAATKERKPRTVSVDLPRNMSLSIKPSDLAKLQTLGRELAIEQAATKAAAVEVGKSLRMTPAEVDVLPVDDVPALEAVLDTAAADLTATKAAEAAIYKRDVDTATRRRLAGEGRALSNLSYPIETHEDAENAVTLALSGHGDAGAAKKLIRRVARKEGWQDILDRLKGGKKKADKTATATADVVKCMTCDGEGMAGGKPCPDCKKGKRAAKKAATPGTAKKKGKIKALCPNCGAKQNREHRHCPECGKPLPAMAPQVHKNHDYVCLGCGKELDKGEKFCPGCGKENPGYLPEADRKIPANTEAKKAAGKGRVAKGRKNSGKPRGKTPAGASGAVSAPEKPVGPHREPDGDAVEALEHSAHMEDGDARKAAKPEAGKPKAVKKGKGKKKGAKKLPPWLKDKDGDDDGGSAEKSILADPSMAAALRLKSLGVPMPMGLAHDLTCPAYDPALVAKCYPEASLHSLDLSVFQSGALEKAAGGSLEEARRAAELIAAITTIKAAGPSDLADIREGAHKMFTDANPGPASFPAPTQISAQRYNRPYLHAGHAAPSPGQDAPNHARIPETGGIQPEDYRRGYLSAGHSDDSPGNSGRPTPMPAPDRTGAPTSGPGRTYYRNSARESAEHAMRLMHDHISQVFPDLCPMHAGDPLARHPVPTPEGVPGVAAVPGTRGLGKAATKAERKARKAQKAAKAAKAKARKARKAAKAKEARLASRVLKGALPLEEAQARLGIATSLPEGVKTVDGAPEPPMVTPLDETVLTAALKSATRPLIRRQKQQDRLIRKQRKVLDAIAGQPDTTGAPFRGVSIPKQASASPAGTLTVAKSAEQAQANLMAQLYDQWRHSPSPEQREAAWAELTKRQLNMNPTQT